jgi:Uma2 family endonuclease
MVSRMPVLLRHRFNIEEYYRMAETGVLKPEARVELLDGGILDMSPIGPFHGGVVSRLVQFFNGCAKGRWLVRPQSPIRLDDYSEPEPDLLLAKPKPGDYTAYHPLPEEALLLIEVADTSLEKDRVVKLPLYGRAGIPEVWIIDLQELTVEVYREPHLTGYSSVSVLRPGNQASPAAFPDVSLDLAALLKKG